MLTGAAKDTTTPNFKEKTSANLCIFVNRGKPYG